MTTKGIWVRNRDAIGGIFLSLLSWLILLSATISALSSGARLEGKFLEYISVLVFFDMFSFAALAYGVVYLARVKRKKEQDAERARRKSLRPSLPHHEIEVRLYETRICAFYYGRNTLGKCFRKRLPSATEGFRVLYDGQVVLSSKTLPEEGREF